MDESGPFPPLWLFVWGLLGGCAVTYALAVEDYTLFCGILFGFILGGMALTNLEKWERQKKEWERQQRERLGLRQIDD